MPVPGMADAAAMALRSAEASESAAEAKKAGMQEKRVLQKRKKTRDTGGRKVSCKPQACAAVQDKATEYKSNFHAREAAAARQPDLDTEGSKNDPFILSTVLACCKAGLEQVTFAAKMT